jgi:hypothetical protein
MTLYTLEDVKREQEKEIIREARTWNTFKTGVYSLVATGLLTLGVAGTYIGIKEYNHPKQEQKLEQVSTGDEYAHGLGTIVIFGSSIGAGMLACGSLNRRRELCDRLKEL